MKNQNLITVTLLLVVSLFILQSHSDGRANRDRDNTGAPGGQMSGNGNSITCSSCHNGGDFDLDLNLELLDEDGNIVTEYIPNETYTARLFISTISGVAPEAYGFQMVSLIDNDNSDVNGWVDDSQSSNAQLIFANSTGRVYAEHNGASPSNELTVQWTAPDNDSGNITFYAVGVGANGNNNNSGDIPLQPIQITYSENMSTSTFSKELIEISIYPNPTAQYVNVVSENRMDRIEIIDVLGRPIMQSFPQSNHHLIDLESVSSGLYFVNVYESELSNPFTKLVSKK